MPDQEVFPTPAAPAAPFPPGEAAVLEWRLHLARRHGGKVAAVLLCAAAAGAWGAMLMHHWVPALAAALLVLSSTGEFLLPIVYRITPSGVEARNPCAWRRMAWSEVRRVYVLPGEIKLSPLRHGGRREAFRGVLLRCPENQAEVLAALRPFCESLLPEDDGRAAGS